MNFSNVKLIFFREVRDQLRDRRTLFMIAVLPILLYPLLGMSFFQISQFMHEQSTSVLIVGARDLADLPPLVENQRFTRELFGDPDRVPEHDRGRAEDNEDKRSGKMRLLELHFAPAEPRGDARKMPDQRAEARRAVQLGKYDAALYFPPDFAQQMEEFQQAIGRRFEQANRENEDKPAAAGRFPPWPRPEIIFTTASEKSQLAFVRLSRVLDRWNKKLVEKNLIAAGMPVSAARPLGLDTSDLAEESGYRGAALWSKIFPVLLLLWAMTGAFYPAIDLCAGEKERGTLETLLSSPAERSEIVMGKLLTIMLFSMVTAALNLVSIALTGWLLLSSIPAGSLPQLGLPPLLAPLWLALALVPISALFAALCLALAALARSTKEGQYYLMPLLLITMPLAVLPMAPGVELNLGNSLIPVTGLVLLLRSALEGGYWQALQFLPVVVVVTLAACMLAIRWAVDQFNSESVLFRESERLDVGLWFRHLFRDRQLTPGAGGALFCGVLILLVGFFISFAMKLPTDFGSLARSFLTSQLVVIAMPALLMTIMFTKSARQTLLLARPARFTIPAAVALAVVLHPAVNTLKIVVLHLYPVTEEVAAALKELQEIIAQAPFWQVVLVLAVVPAICEELAFRGFILSGFRHLGHKRRAIIYSAVFFGVTHTILQQQLVACLLGVVIGFIAVQTGSILPCVVFHLTHNTLTLATTRITPKLLDRWPVVKPLFSSEEAGGYAFHWQVVVASVVASAVILFWFSLIPYRKSAEEELQEAIGEGRRGAEDV